MKERFGEDIEIYTPEQAQREGLTMKDFGNIPSYKTTAPKIEEHPCLIANDFKSGQELRRERRKNNRPKKAVTPHIKGLKRKNSSKRR